MKHLIKTMAFTLLGLVLSMNLWGAKTVTYTVKSTTEVTTSGSAPQNSSATLTATGTLNSGTIQMASGKNCVLTLSGFTNMKITGITLSVKSNSSKGTGSFTAVAGTTTIASISDKAFNTADWHGSWSTTLVDKVLTMTDATHKIGAKENVVLTMAASANSLYIGSWTITYEEDIDPTQPSLSVDPEKIDFGTVDQNAAVPAGQDVEVTFANLTENDVTASITGDFNITSKTSGFTSGDKITVTPKSTATIGTIEGTLTVKTTTDDITKTVPVTMTVAAPEVGVSFEKATTAYTDWTFTNLIQATGTISAKTGTYYGSTDGKATASMVTKNKIAHPGNISCYISKISNNTTSSNWKIQVSEDNSQWTDVKSQSATSMDKGAWDNFTADLSTYSNVYVRIYYDGSTATRAIDDVILTELTPQEIVISSPTGGTLVLMNGETPVATGAQIYSGTKLAVTMTPDGTHVGGTLKVVKTAEESDVTDNVYANGVLTMPAYTISVSAEFTPTYVINIVADGGSVALEDGSGSVIEGRVIAGTEIWATAEADATHTFSSLTLSENVTEKDIEGNVAIFTMPAGDVTITATFNKKQCTILNTPVLDNPSNVTYSGATLNWGAVDNAGAYILNVKQGETPIVIDEMILEGTSFAVSELSANTIYSYSVYAMAGDDAYCDGEAAEGNFTTDDYPAATLTLSENGVETPYSGSIKINTPFNLPDCSVECDKVFVGWSESNENPTNLMAAGSSYTMTETTGTLYAWFATENSGTTTWNKVSTVSVGEYVIINNNFYLPSTTTNSSPSQVAAPTITDNKIANADVTAEMKWILSDAGEGKFYVKNSDGCYLYATNSSSGLRVGNTSDTWAFEDNSGALAMKESTNSRYCASYKDGSDWRPYTSASHQNYNDGGKLYLYKKQAGESSYDNYSLTCSAKANAPEFSLTESTYKTIQTLTITAEDGATIYYTKDGSEPDNTKTLYTGAIQLDTYGEVTVKAIAYVAEKDPSDVVTKTYMMNLPFASLADLVTASEANKIPNNNATVTVTFSNIEIASFNGTKGVYLNVTCENKNIQIYNNTVFGTNWKVGGTLSHSSLTCTWSRFVQSSEFKCWELMPANWEGFVYNDPVHITSIAISGEPTNKDYSDGQTLNPAGLVVTGTYSDSPEHTEVITEGLTWTLPTLEEGATTAQVSVKYTEPVLSNELTSDPYQVTINAVTPAKTLQSIRIADDSEHQTEFFVGRPFNSNGLKVLAKYSDNTEALVTPSVTPPTMTSEGTKQVTVSYTEGDVTADAITYDITLTYMNLNDLVAATDINDHDYVYVKFENVTINKVVSKGIYLDVQKDDKDIEIYCQSTNHSTDWEQYGTVSATLNDVEWTYFTSGSVWELMISNWNAFTYNAPNIPVTSMEISPAEVSVGEAKTTTLSIVYAPENATNTGVTWAVTEGSDNASVDAEGVVTGIKAGTATITATLTADQTITATRTVTVTETPKCEISYYVKEEVASTQEIARGEEGTLTYEPTLTVAGYTFAGWAEAAIAEETATATLISTYTPGAAEATKSVYAVFKRVDDSSPTYQQYAKVTSALTDWAGDYLIAYSDKIFANGQKGGTNDGAIGKQYVNVNPEGALSGNVVTKEWGDQYKVTLEEISAGSNTYVLKTQDGKYNYQTGNSNGLTSSATKATAAQYPISVTFTSENDVKLALGGSASGAVFRYNTDQFFRYYKDGGQKAVYLYKYDAGSVMYTSNPVAKVKVTFNLDGGVGGCGTITVNEGEDVILCEDAPTKDLYKFDAWSDGENEYAPSATIENVTEDIELTALWIAKKQYTITFSKGGAAGTTPDDITDYEYNEVTLPAQGDLSNAGYIFGGWNDGETTHAGGATFTMPEKNVSMTAVWVAKTNDKWVLVTEASQLKAGEKYVIANNENDAVAGDITGSNAYMNKVDATFSDNKQFITAMAGQVELTLGGSTDAWTFAKDASNYLANSSTSLSWSTTASTWKIAFEDGVTTIVEGTNNSLQYNTSSPRFKTYTSSQAAVQLYRLLPAQAINEEVYASTLQEHADVTVNEGGNLLIDAPKTLGDIYVMEGGKVTIQTEATLTVNNFVIKSSMGGGKSGQVLGVTETNFMIESNAYFDVTLGGHGNPEKWHAFAVPFNVDAINGVYDLDDNKLTNEVNYAIMDYHGDVRATGAYGWKKFRGIMNPGVFYLMTVDGQRTTYRMKMKDGFQASSTTITVNEYASGTDTDAGWNGIANNQLGYSSIGVNVQVLNPESYIFETKLASTTNFTVGTPFFYQAQEDGSVVMAAADGSNPAYAPRRVGAAEAKNIAVTLGNDNYTDRLYISATDEATNEYQIGRDLVKMTMTNTPAVPQIFAEAYGTKLCMVDAPMMYDEAVYALNLYAPANGEYTMGAAQVEGYEVFLTQNGSVIWNLSMSEATIELTKGNNTEYGLILKATGAYAPTDINTLEGQESVQKFLYNSNIYIRHNNKTFNVQGQLVK